MARRKIKHEGEHLSHCAGPNWEGDGTSETSACPFKHNQYIQAVRYKCYHCAAGIKPSDIYADAYGIHKHEVDVPPIKGEMELKKKRGRPKGSKNKPK